MKVNGVGDTRHVANQRWNFRSDVPESTWKSEPLVLLALLLTFCVARDQSLFSLALKFSKCKKMGIMSTTWKFYMCFENYDGT